MAFTFSSDQLDAINRTLSLLVTADTSSAATTYYPGFSPTWVDGYDATNNVAYHWNRGMLAGSMIKVTTSTQAYSATNGITVAGINDATAARPSVTFGPGLHINSCTIAVSMGV